MKGLASIVLLLAAALLPAGCSQAPRVRLINDTGKDVVLRVAAENRLGDPPKDLVVRLKAGESRTFFEGHASVRGIQIRAANCDYRFDLPRLNVVKWMEEDRAARVSAAPYGFPVVVQLEPDFTVYWVNLPGRAPFRVSDLRATQAHGFPLRPTSENCGG